MNFWKILKKHVFPNFQADVCVLWTWELVRLKALIQEHLLDTLNIYFWTLENFLEASKNFSRVQKYMFKVSRRCSWIRAFKRTHSHVHRTHTSAWKLGKTCFLKIFQKFISKFDLRFSHFSMDSSTSEASKKFSRAQKYMFKVSRRCSWIRAFERTNSHGHTTHRSKNFADFRFLWKKTHAQIPFWISLLYLLAEQRSNMAIYDHCFKDFYFVFVTFWCKGHKQKWSARISAHRKLEK